MTRGYDIGSARTMVAYLGKAFKHYNERQFARQKLKVELSKLKKISTQSMKKYVHDLERSIADAIRKEQRILTSQQKEDVFHGDLNSRIKELEERLARYFTVHEIRAQRVKLLEHALMTEQQTKGEQLALIKHSLKHAEDIYEKTKKGKKYSKKQLAAVGTTFGVIRAKIEKLEKKYR